MPRRNAIILVAALALLGGCREWTSIDVTDHRIVGDELLMLVETSRNREGLPDSPNDVWNVKAYLLSVPLARASASANSPRARLVGPLWEDEWPLAEGPHVTARRCRPDDWTLTPDGELMATIGPADEAPQWRKLAVANSVAWQTADEFIPPPQMRAHRGDGAVTTKSGRYFLDARPGRATLYDLRSGAEVDDAWLRRAAEECGSIPNFSNTSWTLTDDLKYLVAVPFPIWNDGRHTHSQFVWAGRSYERRDWGLVWERDHEGPRLFPRPPLRSFDAEPTEAFSIGGALYLLYRDELGPRLESLDGRRRWPTTRRSAAPSVSTSYGCTLDAEQRRLRFVSIDCDSVTVIDWRFADDTFEKYPISLSDFFEERWGELRPKHAILAQRLCGP